ncbi:MAG: hypothetical protein ABGW69_00430 [Nanoarchaeota archaeon]
MEIIINPYSTFNEDGLYKHLYEEKPKEGIINITIYSKKECKRTNNYYEQPILILLNNNSFLFFKDKGIKYTLENNLYIVQPLAGKEAYSQIKNGNLVKFNNNYYFKELNCGKNENCLYFQIPFVIDLKEEIKDKKELLYRQKELLEKIKEIERLLKREL